jgi:hypothetical protein
MFKKKLLLIGKNSFISTNIYNHLKKKYLSKKFRLKNLKNIKKIKLTNLITYVIVQLLKII